MPMSNRLEVSCPQPRFPCCLLIQFQLKPKKSMTIFLPTVSLSVCCRYNLHSPRKNFISTSTPQSLAWYPQGWKYNHRFIPPSPQSARTSQVHHKNAHTDSWEPIHRPLNAESTLLQGHLLWPLRATVEDYIPVQ